MTEKAVYLYVFPGFADWEPAHALAEVRRNGGYRVEIMAMDRKAVVSMGGLTILPSTTVADFDPLDAALVIFPGGDRWERQQAETEILALLRRLDELAIPIAAICAATTVVAQAGLLKGRRHTSNGKHYLQRHVQGYTERAQYVSVS